MTGAELRSIRKAMKLSQDEFGAKFGYTKRSVVALEKRGEIPLVVELAAKYLYQTHAGRATPDTETLRQLGDALRIAEALVKTLRIQ